MRNAGIINYVLFWNGNNSLQYAYFVNNGLQSSSINRRFLNVIHKMVQILQIYWSFQEVNKGGRWNSWTPNTRTERQFNCLLSLSLNFLLYLPRCQVIFQWKQTKVRKCLKYIKEFFIVDLTWRIGTLYYCQILI